MLATGGGEGGEDTNQSTGSSHTRLVELGKAVVAKSRSSSRRGEQRPLREGEAGGSDSRQWLKSWSSSLQRLPSFLLLADVLDKTAEEDHEAKGAFLNIWSILKWLGQGLLHLVLLRKDQG